MNDISLLKRNKSRGIFLGCGSSINKLTQQNIDKMEKEFDIWTSNSFMINNHIKPDYYHLEVKAHRNGPLVKRIVSERYKDFQDTKWILDITRPYLLENFEASKYDPKNFYFYRKYYREQNHGNYTPTKDKLGVSLNASLSLICDAIINMDYDEFYFLGVDMTDSRYFWTDNKDYENIKIEDIIKTCKPDERDPDSIQPTFKMKEFIKQIFETNNKKVYNLSDISLLKEVMETKKIGDIL